MPQLQTLMPIVLQPIKKELPTPLKILTSPKTAIVLGLTLGALLNPPAAAAAARFILPKTFKQAAVAAIAVPTVAGILTKPAGRKIAGQVFDPRENIKRGQNITDIISGEKSAKDVLGIKDSSTLKEKVKAGLKAAGIVGGAAAVGLAGVAAVKKTKEVLAARAAKKVATPGELAQLGFTAPQPVGLGGIPIARAPSAVVTPDQQKPVTTPPVQNIIQIQVT